MVRVAVMRIVRVVVGLVRPGRRVCAEVYCWCICVLLLFFFVCCFFNDTATTEIYTRSLVGSVRCV